MSIGAERAFPTQAPVRLPPGDQGQGVGTGTVTPIQRFGGALNMNIRSYMLFPGGVYIDEVNGAATRFR